MISPLFRTQENRHFHVKMVAGSAPETLCILEHETMKHRKYSNVDCNSSLLHPFRVLLHLFTLAFVDKMAIHQCSKLKQHKHNKMHTRIALGTLLTARTR
jgi:hypothetical protein